MKSNWLNGMVDWTVNWDDTIISTCKQVHVLSAPGPNKQRLHRRSRLWYRLMTCFAIAGGIGRRRRSRFNESARLLSTPPWHTNTYPAKRWDYGRFCCLLFFFVLVRLSISLWASWRANLSGRVYSQPLLILHARKRSANNAFTGNETCAL